MPAKILIIDDDADIRSLLKRALISCNYLVQDAGNIQQGIELYRRIKPHVVILDINLPDGNGEDCINNFADGKTVILLMSADNNHLRKSYKDLGAHGFLKKPFKLYELLNVIKQVSLTP